MSSEKAKAFLQRVGLDEFPPSGEDKRLEERELYYYWGWNDALKKESLSMNYDEEMAVFDDITAACKTLLSQKGDDYSGREDRLLNFKRLGKELNLPPRQVLWVYFRKHLDAITSYVRDGKLESCEDLRSRVLDAVNYLVLLECLRLDEGPEKKEEWELCTEEPRIPDPSIRPITISSPGVEDTPF